MVEDIESTDCAPVSSGEFAGLMARLGPFEARPRVAVAVSGGADSMALALLAGEWAASLGGAAVAVTVDHRLRPRSGDEAAEVAARLAERGIRHAILRWEGDKPASDIQAAARAARYDLLSAFCRSEGILHLLLAHHRDDQAETLLLRLGRGSGVDGLAAMAPERPTGWGRVLRPVLEMPRSRLVATLTAGRQTWIEDPSNTDPAYSRVRLRRMAPVLAAEGLGADRLAATAARLGRARVALERATAEAAARFVMLHPAGFARCATDGFAALADEVGLRLLARVLAVVGGEIYPPRAERLERLYDEVLRGLGGARTLSGCRVVPDGDHVVVCREPARLAPPVALVPGVWGEWDGRFRALALAGAPPGLRLGALGRQGWRKVVAAMAPKRPPSLPACARPGIPAIYDQDGVSAVPHLGYNGLGGLAAPLLVEPAPRRSLTVSGIRLV